VLDLPLQLAPGEARPLFQQIAQQIVGFIQAGRLPRGRKLPPTRSLATACGVHRNTVIAAYNELNAQGYVEAGPGRGTFVARQLPEDTVERSGQRSRPRSGPPPAARPAPRRGTRGEGPAFSRLGRALPGIDDRATLLEARRSAGVNLNSGLLALDLFPWDTFRRVLDDVVGRQWRRLTQQDHPLGLEGLREALSEFLFSRGVTADPGEVVVTTGSQQALDLVARLYLEPGDQVAVENPGYPPARRRFELEGAALLALPVDAQGADISRLAALLRRGRARRLKLVYLTPNCQWPTSVRLSAPRRALLAELAEEFEFLVIEDDYAAEMRFQGPAVRPLYMSLPPGRCLNVGSFSKSLLPGLRLGFAVAPPEVTRRLAALKMLTDSHSSLLVQAAVAEFLTRGHFETHLRKLRRECRLRLEALTGALRHEVGAELCWTVPDAGTNLWCELQSGTSATALQEHCREQGLLFAAAAPYFLPVGRMPQAGKHQLLLGFAAVPSARAAATARLFNDCLTSFRGGAAAAPLGHKPVRLEPETER